MAGERTLCSRFIAFPAHLLCDGHYALVLCAVGGASCIPHLPRGGDASRVCAWAGTQLAGVLEEGRGLTRGM